MSQNTKIEISIDDLPEDYKDVASIIGLEKAVELSKEYGGIPIYVPKYKSLIRDIIRKAIIEQYDGTNSVGLARKYRVSTRTIFYLIKESKGEKR